MICFGSTVSKFPQHLLQLPQPQRGEACVSSAAVAGGGGDLADEGEDVAAVRVRLLTPRVLLPAALLLSHSLVL